MLLPMTKVEILGPKRKLGQVTALLHELGVLEIVDLSRQTERVFLRTVEPEDPLLIEKNHLESLQVEINSLLTTLPPPTRPVSDRRRQFSRKVWHRTDPLARAVERFLARLQRPLKELLEQKKALNEELATLAKYEAIVNTLLPFTAQLVELGGFETLALIIERRYKGVLPILRSELSRLTHDQFEIVAADIDENTIAAFLIFSKVYSPQVRSLVWSQNVSEVRLPSDLADLPLAKVLGQIQKKKNEIPVQISALQDELQTLSNRVYWRLEVVLEIIIDRLSELGVLFNFARSDFTFVISGWVPNRDFPRLSETLAREVGPDLVVRAVAAEKGEQPPVYRDNPPFARPYEMLMDLLPPPRYGTIDPTVLLAFVFPFFFGLIIGDIGYGLALVALALVLKNRFPRSRVVQALTSIAVMSVPGVIFFGFLFGEFFGEQFGAAIGLHPIWISRREALPTLMIFTIAFGVGHVFLGLFLGMINSIREKSRRHLLEKIGIMIFLINLGVMVAALTRYLPGVWIVPAFILISISVALLFFSVGLAGFLEAVIGAGNILSYVRLAAIGISSAMLAFVANSLAQATGQSAVGIVLGIVVATLFHPINLVLGLISPSIRSLRLHYVEFFGKFYESGGKKFEPFRRGGE